VFRSDYVAPDLRLRFRGRRQLNRPIRVGPAACCAMMAGHDVDGRGLHGSAAFTAQAAKQIFKGHITLALYQQAHGTEDSTTSAMQAMQLDHAFRPV
jgi:predicted secreted protein